MLYFGKWDNHFESQHLREIENCRAWRNFRGNWIRDGISGAWRVLLLPILWPWQTSLMNQATLSHWTWRQPHYPRHVEPLSIRGENFLSFFNLSELRPRKNAPARYPKGCRLAKIPRSWTNTTLFHNRRGKWGISQQIISMQRQIPSIQLENT